VDRPVSYTRSKFDGWPLSSIVPDRRWSAIRLLPRMPDARRRIRDPPCRAPAHDNSARTRSQLMSNDASFFDWAGRCLQRSLGHHDPHTRPPFWPCVPVRNGERPQGDSSARSRRASRRTFSPTFGHRMIPVADSVSNVAETILPISSPDNVANNGSRTKPSPARSVLFRFPDDRPNLWPAGLE
jgi:hypothetical protein